MNKILVSYFSCSGVTKDVAIKLNEILKGDLFAIVPTNFYTDADLDWNNAYSRSSIEMKDKSARPKVRERVANIGEYDIVFLGYPIWWDEAPRIVNTFLEENNLVGKNIYVFAIHLLMKIRPLERSVPAAGCVLINRAPRERRLLCAYDSSAAL